MSVPLINLVKTPGDGALIAFHACLATSSVASNSLLLLTLLCSPVLLKRNNYLYTLSITVSDLIAGAGWFYLGLYDVSQELEAYDSPLRVLATVHGISLVTIVAAMVDRYLAVKHPFKYLQKMTRTKVVIVIALTWAWPALSIIVRLIFPSGNGQTSQGYVTLIFLAGMFGVMVILNVRLYIVTSKQQNREPHTGREYKHRSAWLIIVASSLFIALWTPNIVHLSICFAFRRCFSSQNIANNPLSILRILNTLTTPLIFMFGSPMTRTSLKALLQRLRFKR
uniref:Somatostatin receptor type 5-like n=1 Tax=Petromyzon marinus TaxID=7757 RepID=A0AAJ7SQ37_PETMA|nr:somatostatin receptor type 5-like [Petromyzon marinus]